MMDNKHPRSDQNIGAADKAHSGKGTNTRPEKPRARVEATVASERPRQPQTETTQDYRRPGSAEEETSLFDRLSDLTSSAYRFAKRTTDGGIRVGRALIKSQDQLKLMLAAGQSLRDLREVAGLTVSDLSDALNLKDKSLLEAVEDGTATLSFELILRLSALLARNDPIPFILRYTRTYNPELWKILNDWGLGRIPLQYEREREFINIYRRHDAARKLSDEGFQHVLRFTREAFDMALHFVAEQENLSDEDDSTQEQPARQRDSAPENESGRGDSPKDRRRNP